ncbi:hypothetical protein B0H10DRAFT_1937940 [Mycena sp. CBHHK59/15]|nr:hypothetical protein B0H10DRAFT_1937940 [Mycena sp. CBHHK59/15]
MPEFRHASVPRTPGTRLGADDLHVGRIRPGSPHRVQSHRPRESGRVYTPPETGNEARAATGPGDTGAKSVQGALLDLGRERKAATQPSSGEADSLKTREQGATPDCHGSGVVVSKVTWRRFPKYLQEKARTTRQASTLTRHVFRILELPTNRARRERAAGEPLRFSDSMPPVSPPSHTSRIAVGAMAHDADGRDVWSRWRAWTDVWARSDAAKDGCASTAWSRQQASVKLEVGNVGEGSMKNPMDHLRQRRRGRPKDDGGVSVEVVQP